MAVTVSCASCGGPCRGHMYRCVDCGRYGSHDPNVEHVIAEAMSSALVAEMEAIRQEVGE